MAIAGATREATLPLRRNAVRRSQILESAVDVFGAKGFSQSSLAEVAGSVGMTAAGLLHHVKTKEALLIELLALRDEADLAEASDPERPRERWLYAPADVDMAAVTGRVINALVAPVRPLT
jgi:AcrR family transcriptional regulator